MTAAIENWNDVDLALFEIARRSLETAALEADLGLEIQEVRGRFEGRIEALRAERDDIEGRVAAFCLARREEFSEKRSRRLRFGRIGFRASERIDVSRELEETVIETLKSLGFSDCVESRERLDRNAMKRLGEADLARCGARRVKEDHVRIEPDLNLASARLRASEVAPAVYPVPPEGRPVARRAS
jgi:phage host-nuclease inhibitor protein Gam